jgi:hypothetical protein
VGPEIRAKAHASTAQSAEVCFNYFFFQVLGTFDFRAHLFLPFLAVHKINGYWILPIDEISRKYRGS